MKASIEVKNREEATAIRTGLEDPTIRAFVVVMGTLNALPTGRARRRVLQYVEDRFAEEEEQASEQPTNGGQP